MVTLEQKDRNSGHKAACHGSVGILIHPTSSGSVMCPGRRVDVRAPGPQGSEAASRRQLRWGWGPWLCLRPPSQSFVGLSPRLPPGWVGSSGPGWIRAAWMTRPASPRLP